jgi:ABC-type dipeptide/oligopeptide/nickel transport system ATPase component
VLLKNAPILVLDEATSALDSEVEAAIQEQLYRLMQGKTVIAIAHRLSTIAAMDRLVVMDAGRIVEEGTHAELLARGGLYYAPAVGAAVRAASSMLAACATATPESTLPKDAIAATRTEANGDSITEYRVAGTLKMVKVVPLRGPTYYLYDRNGDGIVDARDGKDGPLTYYKLFSW